MRRLVTGCVSVVVILTSACSDAPTLPGGERMLTMLVIEASDSSLTVGQTASLTAQGRDQNGNTMALPSQPTYTAVPGGVVTVSGNTITGLAPGTAMILATVGTAFGSVPVTVSGTAAVVAPAADVAEAARAVYSALATGANPTAAIGGILSSLLPVLGPGDEAIADQLIDEGHPFVLENHAALLADAYRQGSLTSLDSFIAGAIEAGARREDGGPLSRAYLTGALAPLIAQTEYGADDIVAALILALGRERASRYQQTLTDPVWGDDWLDPLQTLLLLYSVHFSGAQGSGSAPQSAALTTPLAAPARVAHAANAFAATQLPGWVTTLGMKGIRGLIVGRIGQALEIPLTWGQAGKASLCASILMYGHKFEVTADRSQIHYLHHAGEVLPHRSEITATLTFDFVPSALGLQVLPRIGCNVPPPGAAPGRDVEWSVREPLPQHGNLRDQEAKTDAQGKARAAYEAIDEPWPAELRALEQSVSGTIEVRATGLVPGWKNLERAVGAGVLNPTDAGVRLAVQYHEPPLAFDVSFTTRLQASVTTGSFDLAGFIQGRVQLQDGWRELKRVYYEGTPRFEYTNVSGPPCISGSGPIATTWTGISGPIGTVLYQPPVVMADGSPARLQFNLSATGAGDSPRERVTCADMPTTQTMFMSLWSFARLNLQDPFAMGIRNWTIVSPGVLRAEMNAPFNAPGFTNTMETTVVTLTAVYPPSGQRVSSRRP